MSVPKVERLIEAILGVVENAVPVEVDAPEFDELRAALKEIQS